MHVEGAETPSVFSNAAWALTQHLATRHQHTGPLKSSRGTSSASVDDADAAAVEPALHISALVAMTHCQSILGSNGGNQAEIWQPGRRDYMLLVDMMLLALQRFSVDPYGSCHWAIVLRCLAGVFRAKFQCVWRTLSLNVTAGPAALALLTVAEDLIEGPMAPKVRMIDESTWLGPAVAYTRPKQNTADQVI